MTARREIAAGEMGVTSKGGGGVRRDRVTFALITPVRILSFILVNLISPRGP